MAMTLTTATSTPLSRAERTTLRPSAVSPDGSTGSVSETCTLRLCCSWAMALDRRSIDAGSAVAAPSTSKSMLLSLYVSTTAWYWAVRASTVVHAWASSWLAAPPKDTITSPPIERRAATWSAIQLSPRLQYVPHV